MHSAVTGCGWSYNPRDGRGWQATRDIGVVRSVVRQLGPFASDLVLIAVPPTVRPIQVGVGVEAGHRRTAAPRSILGARKTHTVGMILIHLQAIAIDGLVLALRPLYSPGSRCRFWRLRTPPRVADGDPVDGLRRCSLGHGGLREPDLGRESEFSEPRGQRHKSQTALALHRATLTSTVRCVHASRVTAKRLIGRCLPTPVRQRPRMRRRCCRRSPRKSSRPATLLPR